MRTQQRVGLFCVMWVVRGKPNHFLVYRISSKVRCVFSTRKLATKGPQMSVQIYNEANRTNINSKRTTNSRIFRSGWFALYELFSKPNRRCLQTEPSVGVTPMEYAFEIESSAGCRRIVSLLVVTTNVAAPDVDTPYEDGTAAHDGLHQQFININIRPTP